MQIDDLKDESVNSNDEESDEASDEASDENSDENSFDYGNVDELEPINKPSNNDKNLLNNNLMHIDDEHNNNLKDELIMPKCNIVALNNTINSNNKIELYINGLRIKKVKHLLKICNRYLENFQNEKYLKNLLKKYMNKIKNNKDENITIPCLFHDSKYISQYRYILRLMRKNNKIQNKNKFKYEQNKLRVVEYFYYILCAMGFVNQHGRIIDENASKDFESLTDFLERKIKNINKQ